MKHSTIALIGTFLSLATAVFSMWFFPLNGVWLAGLVLGTGFIVVAGMSMLMVTLLLKEGN